MAERWHERVWVGDWYVSINSGLEKDKEKFLENLKWIVRDQHPGLSDDEIKELLIAYRVAGKLG